MDNIEFIISTIECTMNNVKHEQELNISSLIEKYNKELTNYYKFNKRKNNNKFSKFLINLDYYELSTLIKKII
jgi:hypothetical protein